MAKRELRAVLMDWHGGWVERKTSSGKPEDIGREGRAFWAECYRDAVYVVVGEEWNADPFKLWEVRTTQELCAPRFKKGRAIRTRVLFELVNRRVLRSVFGKRIRTLSPGQLVRIGRKVRQLHRRDHHLHMMYEDTRQLVHWMKKVGLDLYVQTAMELERVEEQMGQLNVPRSCVRGIFTTQALNSSKLRKDFWTRMLAQIGRHPRHALVVGNNGVQDTYCTTVGLPVVVIDRGGEQERFFRQRGAKIRNARIIGDPQEIPPRAPFVAFARTPQEIRDWILAMNPQRQLCFRGVR